MSQRMIRLGEAMRTPERLMESAEAMLQVRARDGRFMALRANAAQREFEVRCGRENVVLKARQMGLTTWIAARFFLRTMTRPGTLTLHVAHTQEAAETILQAVRRMWEGLPAELREGELRLSRASARQMVFAELDSEVRVVSAADDNVGRGLSVQNLHCSEVSRWSGDAAGRLAGLRAALAPDGECVLESTPNGAYGAFYEEWCRAGEQAGAAVRHFFPWWMEASYAGERVDEAEMTAEEDALVSAHGLTGEQIGFRRGLERHYGVLRSQEFAEDAMSCFRATGSCCFDVDVVERRMAEAPEPMTRRRNGELWTWLPPAPGREYVVAVDPAGGGVGGDFAAAQVVDRVTGMQCAELQGWLRPAEMAKAAAKLAREYGEAMIAVERNNHGAAVLAYLDTVEKYQRVWRDERGEAGWLTTSASRPAMIAGLDAMLRERPEALMSRRLLAECRTFVSGANGRMAANAGSHDDLVMAMALAECVRQASVSFC